MSEPQPARRGFLRAATWRRVVSSALLAGAIVALPPAVAAQVADDVVPSFPIEEIEPGQRGYGLSVFSGREPVRFEVEVVGVIENMRPGTSFVLARLSGRGLEETGVIAGMSGSPVYIDDRLVGAVAFGWPFALEAIAGITPISAMRRLSEGSDPQSVDVAAGSALDLEAIARRDLPESLLFDRLAELQPRLAEGARSGMMWSLAGFSPRVVEMLSDGLGAVAGGGASSTADPAQLQPGGAVAGVLIDGDLHMAATGTVTDRNGDEVLAFGHPFLGLGETRIPMATADVVTVLGSQYSSFKIANIGEVVGAFDVDRAPGIHGRIGLDAPTVPLTVEVHSDRDASFEMQLAQLPSMTPTLAAIALISCVDETTQSAGRGGVDLRVDYALGERGPFSVEQSFDGDSAVVQAAVYVLSVTGFLEQNDFGPVDLESIAIELSQYPRPRTHRLVGAYASRSLVQPGEVVTLTLEVTDGEGVESRRSLDVRLPTGIPSGRYSLFVGDGASADAARLAIEQTAPVTIDQALEYLARLHSSRDLVVLGVFAEQGLSVAGELLPQLPGSVRSIWGAAASTDATPVNLAIAQEQSERLEYPLLGIVRIDLEVRRRVPLAAGGGSADSGASGGPAGGAPAGSGGESGASGRAGERPSGPTKKPADKPSTRSSIRQPGGVADSSGGKESL